MARAHEQMDAAVRTALARNRNVQDLLRSAMDGARNLQNQTAATASKPRPQLRHVSRPSYNASRALITNAGDVCVAIPCAPKHWGKLLARALRSVAGQTYVKISKAVIVLSLSRTMNCSSYNPTAKLLRISTQRPSRPPLALQVVCNERTGFTRGQNRNLGAAACRGSEWVAFIDADDEMRPTRIQRMVGLLEAHNASLGLHSYYVMDDRPVSVTGLRTSGALQPPVEMLNRGPINATSIVNATTSFRVAGPEALFQAAWHSPPAPVKLNLPAPMFMAGFGTTHHGHAIVHASVFPQVPKSERLARGEDVDFIYRAVTAGVPAVWTEEPLSIYHVGATVSEMPRGYPASPAPARRRQHAAAGTLLHPLLSKMLGDVSKWLAAKMLGTRKTQSRPRAQDQENRKRRSFIV